MNDDNQNDDAIKSTADDAILAKLSCVQKGYYEDPFVHSMSFGACGLVHKSSSSSRTAAPTGSGRSGANNGRSDSRFDGRFDGRFESRFDGHDRGQPQRQQFGRYGHREEGGPSDSSGTTEPIIRRGTHARVAAVDRAIDSFVSLPLESSSDEDNNSDTVTRQVVVLGAGRDTTHLRRRFGCSAENGTSKIMKGVRWYEVDHPSVVRRKATSWLSHCVPDGYDYNCELNQDTGSSYAIRISPTSEKQQGANDNNNNDKVSNYHLIGHDLRSPPSSLFTTLTHLEHGYNRSIPTLFVLECVVMYLPNDASWELLRCLADSVKVPHGKEESRADDPFAAVVLYDPIPCHDRFGSLMIENLSRAGITSRKGRNTGSSTANNDDSNGTSFQSQQQQQQQLSLEKTRTLSDQLCKLTGCGFDIAAGCDMNDAYNHGVIPASDARRASRCEMLDELEEFTLLMRHYCLAIGVASYGRSKRGGGRSDDGKAGSSEGECVGLRLCEVGEDSAMGFKKGRCTVVHGK